MSFGLGGDTGPALTPGKAPRAPGRMDKNIDDQVMRRLKRVQRSNSVTNNLLYQSGGQMGGGAAGPTKSHTAQLFAGGM